MAISVIFISFLVTQILPINHVRSRQPETRITEVNTEPSKKPEATPSVYVPQFSGNQLRVPIILYHYLSDNPDPKDLARYGLSVGPAQFDEEMKYLADNGYTSMTFDSLYPAFKNPGLLPPKPVVITFDDGYSDFYYNAYPILKKYGINGTVFIPTALMNQGYYLTWNQIKEMAGSNLIHFESHGVHHYSYPSISHDTLVQELTESKKVLQDLLGVPINFIAYPYGTTDGSVIEAVKQAGYTGAIGTWPNKIQSEGTLYNMPRLKVGGGMDLKRFAELL